MMKPEATLRERFRKLWKRQHYPLAAGPHNKSSKAVPSSPQQMLPPPNLVVDPIADLSRAEEAFHASQVSDGLEILSRNGPIDTAADEQNVAAAREALHRAHPNAQPSTSGQPESPGPATLLKQPSRVIEPYNNPFSMVPGGPGFGFVKPPGM